MIKYARCYDRVFTCLHNSSLRLNRHFFSNPLRGDELGKFYCAFKNYPLINNLPPPRRFRSEPTSRSNDSANQNEQMEISVIQAPNGCIHKV